MEYLILEKPQSWNTFAEDRNFYYIQSLLDFVTFLPKTLIPVF